MALIWGAQGPERARTLLPGDGTGIPNLDDVPRRQRVEQFG